MTDQADDAKYDNPGVNVTPIEHGFGEITLPSWEKFVSWINRLESNNYIWRGQRRADWKLQSTWDRIMAARGEVMYPSAVIADHLTRFKLASRGRRGPSPPAIQSENEWWALGQHHGLATPLLDWTSSPFAAAFFAFMEPDSEGQTEHRAIWGLHRFSLVYRVGELLNEEKAKADANRIALTQRGHGPDTLVYALLATPPQAQIEMVIPQSDENQRLVSQSGLFTRTPSGLPIEEWMKKNFPKDRSEGYVLVKLLVPNQDRVEALRMLNRMNINHSTMFPDLDGAARFCNMATEIDQY